MSPAKTTVSATRSETRQAAAPGVDSLALPGDAEPRPLWPFYLALAAWIAWMLFLMAMMIQRMQTTPV